MATISGLYALTPDLLDTDELIARVTAAIAGGAAALQYRNKIASPPLRRAQALALRDLCAVQGTIFIVNDDVNLAYAVDADGVHLGRDDVPLVRARQRLGSTAIIGASCYDSLECAAAAVAAGADYVAFGSFFPSSVKPDAVRVEAARLHCAKVLWNVATSQSEALPLQRLPRLSRAAPMRWRSSPRVRWHPDVTAAAKAFRDAFVAATPAARRRAGMADGARSGSGPSGA